LISISVVVPTHNRASRLTKHLLLLAEQSLSPEKFEVIVVADGCTDDTVKIVQQQEFPYPVTVLQQEPGKGASSARNRGAAAAQADILLFLDDDMEPSRQLLSAHLHAHRTTPGGVVLGYFPMQSPGKDESVFTKSARLWWAESFASRAEGNHRFSFWDFCTGNVSVARGAFENAGAFDESIGKNGAGEDYELGYRLIRNRIPFQFVREALSVHHTTVSWDDYLFRAEQEGFGQAVTARKHPELFWEFNVAHLSRLSESTLLRPVWVALWKAPKLGEPAIATIRTMARLLLAMNLQSLFWRLQGILRGHAYWKGVRSALGTLSNWERLAQDAPYEPSDCREVDFDVSRDLQDLDEFLSSHGPVDAMRVYANGQPVGRIAPRAAAESLRPQHVRALLVSRFSSVLLGELVSQMKVLSSSSRGALSMATGDQRSEVNDSEWLPISGQDRFPH
jgi:glycosyltransferase involved in cell wall biosynthesis